MTRFKFRILGSQVKICFFDRMTDKAEEKTDEKSIPRTFENTKAN